MNPHQQPFVGAPTRLRTLVVAEARANAEAMCAALAAMDECFAVSAASAEDVLDGEAVALPRSDVALLSLPISIGPSVLTRLSAELPVPCVAYGLAEDEDLVSWLEAGIVGCLDCRVSLAQVAGALADAALGIPTISQSLSATLMRRLAERRTFGGDASALTRREGQILQLLAEGMSNKEIATSLCVQTSTVKNHIQHLFRKLDVHSRTEAATRHLQSSGTSLGGHGWRDGSTRHSGRGSTFAVGVDVRGGAVAE